MFRKPKVTTKTKLLGKNIFSELNELEDNKINNRNEIKEDDAISTDNKNIIINDKSENLKISDNANDSLTKNKDLDNTDNNVILESKDSYKNNNLDLSEFDNENQDTSLNLMTSKKTNFHYVNSYINTNTNANARTGSLNKNKSSFNKFSNKQEQNPNNFLKNKLKKTIAFTNHVEDSSKLPTYITEKDLKKSKKGLYNESNKEIQQSNVKKVFLAENLLKNAKTQDDIDDLIGKEKIEIQKQREKTNNEIKSYLKKNLYSLPENLKIEEKPKEDYVEHLLQLSQCGLIEVPLPLEERLKCFKATENEFKNKSLLSNNLEQDVDLLKSMYKNGPTFSKSFENDLASRKQQKLNKMFKDVFDNYEGKRRKHDHIFD